MVPNAFDKAKKIPLVVSFVSTALVILSTNCIYIAIIIQLVDKITIAVEKNETTQHIMLSDLDENKIVSWTSIYSTQAFLKS